MEKLFFIYFWDWLLSKTIYQCFEFILLKIIYFTSQTAKIMTIINEKVINHLKLCIKDAFFLGQSHIFEIVFNFLSNTI